MPELGVDNDTRLEIMRFIAEMDSPIGADALASLLKDRGISLTSTAVRYHLRMLDQQGFTSRIGKQGRVITSRGWDELQRSRVDARMQQGLAVYETAAQVAALGWAKGNGHVVGALTIFPTEELSTVLLYAVKSCRAGLCISDRMALLKSGDKFGTKVIPPDKTGIVTVATTGIDGFLLSNGVLFRPTFGGIVEVIDWHPYRFVDIVDFGRGTRAPVDILISSGSTHLLGIIEKGNGLLLADIREIIGAAREHVLRLLRDIETYGLGGVLMVGQIGQPVMGVPVQQHTFGVAMIAGINPTVAAFEAGVSAEYSLNQGMIDFASLRSVEQLAPTLFDRNQLAVGGRLVIWEQTEQVSLDRGHHLRQESRHDLEIPA